VYEQQFLGQSLLLSRDRQVSQTAATLRALTDPVVATQDGETGPTLESIRRRGV